MLEEIRRDVLLEAARRSRTAPLGRALDGDHPDRQRFRRSSMALNEAIRERERDHAHGSSMPAASTQRDGAAVAGARHRAGRHARQRSKREIVDGPHLPVARMGVGGGDLRAGLQATTRSKARGCPTRWRPTGADARRDLYLDLSAPTRTSRARQIVTAGFGKTASRSGQPPRRRAGAASARCASSGAPSLTRDRTMALLTIAIDGDRALSAPRRTAAACSTTTT